MYIGEPKKKDQGTDAKIQVNDVFITTKDIVMWASRTRDELPENERDQFTVSFKVDIEAKRGIIADVETELRKANARKILYSAMAKKIDQ